VHPDDEGFHRGQTAVVERGHRSLKNFIQPQMDTDKHGLMDWWIGSGDSFIQQSNNPFIQLFRT
jgi:hypothetical protein